MTDTPRQIYPLSFNIAQRKWKNWQLAQIDLENGEKVSRKNIIMSFVKKDLGPFIHKNGYEFACDNFRVAECISRVLYTGSFKHEPINTNYIEEDYNHYYYAIDDTKWNAFWRAWNWWEDLGDEYRNLHEEIRFCIWTLLDIDRSKQTRVLNELLGISNDDDNSSSGSERKYKSRDPYLADAANGYFN